MFRYLLIKNESVRSLFSLHIIEYLDDNYVMIFLIYPNSSLIYA